MAEHRALAKISISGATLASIIQLLSSSPGDIDGLLFGHVTRLPAPGLYDDDGAAAALPPSSPLSATVTGHLSLAFPASFYDALGRVDLRQLLGGSGDHRRLDSSDLIGWFSGRRRSPLRPSMRERAVSLSLFKTPPLDASDGPSNSSGFSDLRVKPSIFLLLSSSVAGNQAVHTHEYRAFVLCSEIDGGGTLQPKSLNVINVGPAFRGQYSTFSPDSALPWMPCRQRGAEDGEEEEKKNKKAESWNSLRHSALMQRLLDSLAEGFGLERLGRLVGPGPLEYASELEDLYKKMLLKLENLVELVEKSSARVLEQEKHNSSLRSKIAGWE